MVPGVSSVLVITLFYPPHHYGGYEIACQSAVNGLVGRGHTVTVLTADLRLEGRGEDHPAAPVRRELRPYVHEGSLQRPSLMERLRTERHNQRALRRALDEVDPDVVSVWHMGALSLGLLSTVRADRLPMVAVIADDWLIYGVNVDPWMSLFETERRSRPVRRLAGRVIERLSGVPTRISDLGSDMAMLFTSEDNRRRALDGGVFDVGRNAVSYLGIDTAAFTDIGDVPGEPGLLLYAGRCDPRKGIDTVIEALASLPGHRLEIRSPDGDDSHGQDLRRRARDLEVADRVAWCPAVDQRVLAGRMAAASAVVFPSRWAEPFGLVPIEAMACGTPVLATGVGGSGEFLADGTNCLRFDPDDAAGLVDAVRRLDGDDALRTRLIAGGRRTAEYFGRDRFTDVIERWHVGAAARFPDGTPDGRLFDPGAIVD